jgi:hypothetical protein
MANRTASALHLININKGGQMQVSGTGVRGAPVYENRAEVNGTGRASHSTETSMISSPRLFF